MTKKKDNYVNEEFCDFVDSIPQITGQQNAFVWPNPTPPAKCAKVLVQSGKREYQGIVLGFAKQDSKVSRILVRSTSYVFWNSDRWESIYDVYEVSE